MADTPPLPNPSRHITINSEQAPAKSKFSDIPHSLSPINNLNGALFRLAYNTATPSPVQLKLSSDVSHYTTTISAAQPPGLVPIGGAANVWYVDTPPHAESPMHRTMSLDFVIQISGVIELEMEDGEIRTVGPGDCVVQRGTGHRWRNRTGEWCRMVAVMSECEQIKVGGQELGVYFGQ